MKIGLAEGFCQNGSDGIELALSNLHAGREKMVCSIVDSELRVPSIAQEPIKRRLIQLIQRALMHNSLQRHGRRYRASEQEACGRKPPVQLQSGAFQMVCSIWMTAVTPRP